MNGRRGSGTAPCGGSENPSDVADWGKAKEGVVISERNDSMGRGEWGLPVRSLEKRQWSAVEL